VTRPRALSYVETLFWDTITQHLINLTDAAMSPDSEHLYTQTTNAPGGRFVRRSVLHAFDATTQSDRPSVNTETNLAVVAAGRAAWMIQRPSSAPW
jgi:hypothetical protein